jgi:hypothetical protein
MSAATNTVRIALATAAVFTTLAAGSGADLYPGEPLFQPEIPK